MVFSKVLIIKGTLFEETDVYDLGRYLSEIFPGKKLEKHMKSISKGDKKDHDNEEKVRHTIELINKSISHWNYKIYEFPCCSSLGNKFIFGTKIKSYHRLKTRCDKCEKHTSCDKCLGMTENGFYDVVTIFENVVEAPSEIICFACGNDKRSKGVCKFCNYETLKETCEVQEYLKLDSRLDEFLSKNKIGYYYMLDDCLSCS
jgi:hypothetical protein